MDKLLAIAALFILGIIYPTNEVRAEQDRDKQIICDVLEQILTDPTDRRAMIEIRKKHDMTLEDKMMLQKNLLTPLNYLEAQYGVDFMLDRAEKISNDLCRKEPTSDQ